MNKKIILAISLSFVLAGCGAQSGIYSKTGVEFERHGKTSGFISEKRTLVSVPAASVWQAFSEFTATCYNEKKNIQMPTRVNSGIPAPGATLAVENKSEITVGADGVKRLIVYFQDHFSVKSKSTEGFNVVLTTRVETSPNGTNLITTHGSGYGFLHKVLVKWATGTSKSCR